MINKAAKLFATLMPFLFIGIGANGQSNDPEAARRDAISKAREQEIVSRKSKAPALQEVKESADPIAAAQKAVNAAGADKIALSQALQNLALAYYDKGNLEAGAASYVRARAVYLQDAKKNKAAVNALNWQWATVLTRAATSQQVEGKLAKSGELFEQAKSTFMKSGIPELPVHFLTPYVNYLHAAGRSNEAAPYAQKLKLLQEVGDNCPACGRG